MRAWAVATGVLAVGSALVVAGLLGVRAQASAEQLTGALVAAELKARPEQVPPVRAAAASAAASRAGRAPVAPSPANTPEPAGSGEPATAPAPHAPSFRQTHTYNGNIVYVPEGCADAYDVILHFHGAHPYVKELAEKAQISAVIAVFNSGNGAERYAQAFQAGGMLSSLLRQVSVAAAPWCGAGAKPRRIALTAWSAGYSATEKLLSRPEDRERIDAVLLADGLHAGFADPRRRLFAPNALLAFRDFGELAKQDQKLFAITHSSIATEGYASTTECSKLLLKLLNVPSEGPLVSGKAGSFSIEGSTGDDKSAHISQFRGMDSSLLSKLRERWSR